jgi:hypothetical protein
MPQSTQIQGRPTAEKNFQKNTRPDLKCLSISAKIRVWDASHPGDGDHDRATTMTTTKLNRGAWNTYAVYGYTHQVGTDGRATGGVHLHQVRRGRAGWQVRTVDSNGRFQSAGPVSPVTDAEGEAHFETARTR